MTLEQTLERLYALHRFGIKPGLERTLQLLEHCGNPHRAMKFIHVAGTNGKGSVCSMLAAILAEHGLRVGLYTSPHLRRFNERIQINGVMISDRVIARLFERVEPFITMTEATFFEVTTVMALLYFGEQNVDCCVLETGMGGRFDATNVVSPLACAITSIDLDHQEYLGNTLEHICFEKAGIIKPGIPIVSAESRTELNAMIRNVASEREAPFSLSAEFVSVESLEVDVNLHMRARWSYDAHQWHEVMLPLSGQHQLRNLGCALTVLHHLREYWQVDPHTIESGLKKLGAYTHLQARIQVLKTDPPLIVDVGHNTACMKQLVETVHVSPYAQMRWNIVFGIMADKDCRQMLEILQSVCATLTAVQPRIERSMSSNDIVITARELGLDTVDAGSVAEGVRMVVAMHQPTLICGSFYLMEEALAELGVDV